MFIQKQLSEGLFKKGVMRSFAELTRKHMRRNLFFDNGKFSRSETSTKTSLQRLCFLVNFAKFLRTPFSQNITGRLLLIIAVSIVVKEELANGTVNYDTKTKASCIKLSRKCKLLKKGSPGERKGFKSSSSQTSNQVFLKTS